HDQLSHRACWNRRSCSRQGLGQTLYHRIARRLMGTEAAAGDLEHRTVAVRPAYNCRAEQVGVGVGDQAGRWFGTVCAIEVEQGGWGAGVAVSGLGDLEHRAEAAERHVSRSVRPARSGLLYGGDNTVSRQRPPDPLQLELAHWLDFHRVLDLHQHARADENLPTPALISSAAP